MKAMKRFKYGAQQLAGVMMLLLPWAANAETDKACKGSNCPAVKTEKRPAPPESRKVDKDAGAVKWAPGSADRSEHKVAPTADGSVRKAAAGDGSVRK